MVGGTVDAAGTGAALGGAGRTGGRQVLLGTWGPTRQGSTWRDEAATRQGVHCTVPELWRVLAEVDAVHGLYHLLMHNVFALAPDNVLTPAPGRDSWPGSPSR
ncbi:hypothetical protein ABZ464_18365 [Streptomyces sp. NPDC005820]|uniref:hypothetical protein n=1 Tax=Streptomyces sp. NPDC005820 TaxID=3157069 RepID=UPI0033F98624